MEMCANTQHCCEQDVDRRAAACLNKDAWLNKAPNAWRPSVMSRARGRRVAAAAAATTTTAPLEEKDPGWAKTQEVFRLFRSVLNKLTPEKFDQLMKRVEELDIVSEERLKGVMDLTFEKAVSEPAFSEAYAKMCHHLMEMKVQTPDGQEVDFRRLLLNRCQEEFEKNKEDDDFLKRKGEELEAESQEQRRLQLAEELEEAEFKARRRSLGNVKFIGELFKLKMLSGAVMHDCIKTLLDNKDDESLECLCRLVSTMGKELDQDKAKPRMELYFKQMEQMVKRRETSSRIRFMLQDVVDLRLNKWLPRRKLQGPKTISQIHQEAEQEVLREKMEAHRDKLEVQVRTEQVKVHRAVILEEESTDSPGDVMDGDGSWEHWGTSYRCAPPLDLTWSTIPVSNDERVDLTHCNMSKILRVDVNNLSLRPGWRRTRGDWNRGCGGFARGTRERSDRGQSERSLEGQRKDGSCAERHNKQRKRQHKHPHNILPDQHRPLPSVPPPTPCTRGALQQDLCTENMHSQKQEVNFAKLQKQLDLLIQDGAENQTISHWIQMNMDKQQNSNMLVRALITCICCFTVTLVDRMYKLNYEELRRRLPLLQDFIQDHDQQLQALEALQLLIVHMDQPAQLLRMIFDCLYDNSVIAQEAFFTWASSGGAIQQEGKDSVVESVSGFLHWLRSCCS